jgi:alcohol dehydrogenase class IV
MLKSFDFARTPRIIFGAGKIAELPGIAKKYGNDILLVTGKESFLNSKYGEYLLHTFDLTGIVYHHVIINNEPSPEMINQAVILNKNHSIKLVIAIGGGSVIDAGKAISAMLLIDDLVENFLEGIGKKEHPGTKVPFIAVPTTSGTGSEATKNAVISHVGNNGFKRSLRHDNFIPEIAVVDPELTLDCPPFITATSGMDCFTQLVESNFSAKANPFTNALAIDGIRFVKKSLLRAYRMPHDIEARSGMAYAANLSGITLANAGLGAVHGFASSIGAFYTIPHGVVCGSLMASANSVLVQKLRKTQTNPLALSKYAEIGRILSEATDKTEEWYTDSFLDTIKEWSEIMAIPKLSKYGIKSDDLNFIVSETDPKTNPVTLDKEDLLAMLVERI